MDHVGTLRTPRPTPARTLVRSQTTKIRMSVAAIRAVHTMQSRGRAKSGPEAGAEHEAKASPASAIPRPPAVQVIPSAIQVEVDDSPSVSPGQQEAREHGAQHEEGSQRSPSTPALAQRAISRTVSAAAAGGGVVVQGLAPVISGAGTLLPPLSPLGGSSRRVPGVVEEMKMKIRETDLADLDSGRVWAFKYAASPLTCWPRGKPRESSQCPLTLLLPMAHRYHALFPLLARLQRLDHYARVIFPLAYVASLVYFFSLVQGKEAIPASSPCA